MKPSLGLGSAVTIAYAHLSSPQNCSSLSPHTPHPPHPSEPSLLPFCLYPISNLKSIRLLRTQRASFSRAKEDALNDAAHSTPKHSWHLHP